MMTKTILGLTLVLSLLANISAVLLIKNLYLNTNLLRLDPLQFNTYQTAPEKIEDKKRVVFFGDSRALSWPAPTLKGFEFINRGIGQQTSEQIRLRYDQHIKPLKADIIVLQLCVNDLKVIPLHPMLRKNIVSQCKHNIKTITQQARQQGATVILSTIFPLGTVPLERTPFWSDEVAVAINEVNQFIWSQEADNVIVLNGYSLLQEEQGNIKSEYSKDLLHLSAAGYSVLNQQLGKLLKNLQ